MGCVRDGGAAGTARPRPPEGHWGSAQSAPAAPEPRAAAEPTPGCSPHLQPWGSPRGVPGVPPGGEGCPGCRARTAQGIPIPRPWGELPPPRSDGSPGCAAGPSSPPERGPPAPPVPAGGDATLPGPCSSCPAPPAAACRDMCGSGHGWLRATDTGPAAAPRAPLRGPQRDPQSLTPGWAPLPGRPHLGKAVGGGSHSTGRSWGHRVVTRCWGSGGRWHRAAGAPVPCAHASTARPPAGARSVGLGGGLAPGWPSPCPHTPRPRVPVHRSWSHTRIPVRRRHSGVCRDTQIRGDPLRSRGTVTWGQGRTGRTTGIGGTARGQPKGRVPKGEG